MRLREFLSENEISEAAFSAQVGVSQVAVHRYVAGQRTPSYEIMLKIMDITGGEVTANDFYPRAPA
jgi:predicted transcriptional regulator